MATRLSTMTAATFTLRLARPADASLLATMSREFIEDGLRWTWRAPRIARQIESSDTVVLVALEGRRLAGFAIMSYGDTNAHLNLLAVDPAYRMQGLGRRMVDWLEKTARNAGIFRITLEVRAQNFGGRCFYKALGYREVLLLRGYYQGAEDAVRMRHNLRVDVTSS
ncbi:MAG: GNAT family N-acetyltransferase [Gammaproteobacteria bacterium]|nr:GNAT family N-acetyltransferase [Gammaproteobacteria bacterium]NND59157.1 GNAT family N-acetyltransferase [Gammaproteobacteria bacterium]